MPAGADNTLESVLPRDGLQLYFEVRGEGLPQLAKLAAAASPAGETGKSGGLSVKELSGFALAHLAVLAGSRIALVTYAGAGFAVVIETANPNDARRIADDLDRALNRAQSRARTAGTVTSGDKQPDTVEVVPAEQRKFGSAVIGRVAIAGAESAVERITDTGAPGKLADDPDFLKSKSRFASDPFFGYLAANMAGIPNPPAGEEIARGYMQGWALAQQTIPRSLVFGGSIAGDTAEFHAFIDKPQGKPGVLSSFLSAVKSAQPTAAGFACKDTDVFVDVMVDWNSLYQALAPMAGMILGASVPDGSAGGASALDKKLGFSIKDDLLPTLGGELAIAIHFPPGPLQPKAPQAGPAPKPPSTGFYVILGLKDKVRFEALITRLFLAGNAAPTGPSGITTAQYRGFTIKSIKGFSYVIADGFFIGCAGAANLRKLLDERSAGGTLASKLEYHAAIGAPGVSLVQVYLSGNASARFLQKEQGGSYAKARPGLGFVMSQVPSGISLNVRIPATLAAMALSSAMNSSGGVFGIGPSAQSAAESSRIVNGRPVPKMSSDDIPRRP